MSGWNLIESDAAVFTSLVSDLQIPDLQFEELYSIDESSLRSYGQLYGVIFLFKYTSKDQSDTPITGEYLTLDHFLKNDYDDAEKQYNDVSFAKQTIQNACATQAVLNVLLNRSDIDLGPELTNFKEFVEGFDPIMKGETISNSENIRTIHNSFSSPNRFIDETDNNNQDIDDSETYHFIGFVWKNGMILELDGLKDNVIFHGYCKNEEDFYSILPNVLNERIKNYKSNELMFSLLGIYKDFRIHLKEIGDFESLAKEEAKRLEWLKENDLRRSDLIGLVNDVVKTMTQRDDWEDVLNKASTKGMTRLIASKLRK